MHVMKRAIATMGVLTLALAGSAMGVHRASADSGAVGYVYVNDNTAATNTVVGYARHADGSLTQLPGSPFAIGGAGLGAITGSQGALQISDDGRYLLAVDAGSNQISVLRIRPDGTLRAVEGSPIWSGGNEPVSIAVHGNVVYVANTGVAKTGGANYSGFTLDAGGHLRPLAGSTFSVTSVGTLVDVLFNADGTHLAGTRVGTTVSSTWLIDSFSVGADGLLTSAPGSPFAAQAAGPFGSAFRPTDPSQLFVSNAHAGGGKGTISAFSVSADGTLTSIGASPFADNQTAPCWVTISPDGQYLFAMNTASDTISGFAIAANGSLTLLGSTLLNGAPGLRAFDLQTDPSGKFLYVVEAAHNAIGMLRADNGNLSEVKSSPVALPTGATAFGIVVTGVAAD